MSGFAARRRDGTRMFLAAVPAVGPPLSICMLSLTGCSNSCENYCDATKDCKTRVVNFGEHCIRECEVYFGDDPDELKCGQESQDLLDCLADSDTPCLDSDECLPVAYARSACFEPDPR